MPIQKKLPLRTLIGVAALALAAFAGTGASAVPTASTAPTPEEVAYSQQVSDFLAAHPDPAAAETSALSRSDRDQRARELAAYWETVPWDAVAGQWGCTVQYLGTSLKPAASGELVALVSLVYDSACVKASDGAATRVEARPIAATNSGGASLMSYDDNCGTLGANLITLCMGFEGPGVAYSWQNDALFGTRTSYNILSSIAPDAGCAEGDVVSVGPTVTLSPGQYIKNQSSSQVSTQYVNSLYDSSGGNGSYVGQYCATF
ncbi:hypothetical protein SAMN06295879_3281 [Agreia bicolorata]|uniref:Secreted protein n=1 Tax=Agreia bicolorata TaxID=110935 RepID=A0A1T4YIG8_9MICO|nr:hypothetical protein [Agreia bicolorata]SKB01579.1 hypothetical protein SAMN06295879_3281 [Agreia bicolorata]